jgi:hypothetical protein
MIWGRVAPILSTPSKLPPTWGWLRPILRLDQHIWLARLAVLIVHLVLVGGGYRLVLRIADVRAVSLFDSSSWIDYWMQPVPWAFWIYATLYLYFPATVLLSPRTRQGLHALLLHLQAQILLSVLTWCVFLLMPTEIHIRSQMEWAVKASTPTLQKAYDILYALDARWNAWPSLHVSLSLLMLLACVHFTVKPGDRHSIWRRGRGDRWMAMAGFAAWLALCWSILATKQHFFFDLWTGAAAGMATWVLYLRPRLHALSGIEEEPRIEELNEPSLNA